jgi:hypothetical protein
MAGHEVLLNHHSNLRQRETNRFDKLFKGLFSSVLNSKYGPISVRFLPSRVATVGSVPVRKRRDSVPSSSLLSERILFPSVAARKIDESASSVADKRSQNTESRHLSLKVRHSRNRISKHLPRCLIEKVKEPVRHNHIWVREPGYERGRVLWHPSRPIRRSVST